MSRFMLKISNKKILLITTSTADNRVRILYNSGQKNGKIHRPKVHILRMIYP